MKKILIIEDDRFFQKMLSDLLKIEGYDVEIANNGKEGTLKFAHFKPDLVITDIIMPEKEGTETILELLSVDPSIKIIAISGGGRVGYIDYLQTVKELGTMATFAKPFKNQDLIDKIKELLS